MTSPITFELTHPQATDDELRFLNRVFSSAIFMVRPGGYYDVGTKAKFIECMYLVGRSQPCALVCGIKDGREDEEISSLSEFDVTWPDESVDLPEDDKPGTTSP